MKRHVGVRPYYRRRLRNGWWRVYCRLRDGGSFVFDGTKEAADLMPSGKSYTIEEYGPLERPAE